MSRSEINEKPDFVPPKLPSLPYTLFEYRQELRQRSTEYIRISALKMNMTDNLILETIRNIRNYDVMEVMNISRQVDFKRKLFDEMKKAYKLEKKGVIVDPREYFKKPWYPLKPKFAAIKQD